MSKYIPGNHKHLSAADRLYIERELNAGSSFKNIARYLCKDPSTISKEISANTVEAIKRILFSRKYEVQIYRQCIGVLGFAKKYGKKVLEECRSQALGLNKVTYTFIKNSIPAIAKELNDSTDAAHRNEDKNNGAYVMSPSSADINRLLAKSKSLVEQAQKGGHLDENH